MNCEQFLLKIDAYIDGELSNDELNEMREHAENCEACRMEMEKADLLRDTLNGIDDDIVVPLEAQAAWRKAVRAEAKHKNVRKWTRGLYVVAAALVLVLGCTLAMNGDMFADKNIAAPKMAAELIAVVDAGVSFDSAEETHATVELTAVKKFAVSDINTAMDAITNLLEEYEVSKVEKIGGGGNILYYVELPFDNQEGFLNSLSVLGEEINFVLYDVEDDVARIRIDLVEK